MPWDLGYEPALHADQVLMVVFCEVVDGGSVSEVGMIHDSHSFELVEESIHGRSVDRWLDFLGGIGELVGGRVLADLDEGADDGTARSRDPAPVLA